MGDWKLTDFNSRLTQSAYANSYDRPRTGKRSWQQNALPPEPAPATADAGSRAWYYGPSQLTPENMGNMMLYFRERPGARFEKIAKPLAYFGALSGFACLLLIVGLIVNSSHASAAAIPATARPHPGLIGILNPEWVRIQSSLQQRREWREEYFSIQDNANDATTLPPKFIYTPPEAAQRDLVQLIEIGAVNFDGGLPNVVKDFAQLKKLGITTD